MSFRYFGLAIEFTIATDQNFVIEKKWRFLLNWTEIKTFRDAHVPLVMSKTGESKNRRASLT
jgi:hypothetical protein